MTLQAMPFSTKPLVCGRDSPSSNTNGKASAHDVQLSDSSAETGLLRCRVCESKSIVKRGEVEFYFGYAWPIYDCNDCGCRFTRHDASIYELLYSERGSRYGFYNDKAQSCKTLFDRHDLEGLRAELSQISKYGFIIDQIDHEPTSARILEIGCSRGQLTSYFILGGREITGVDVSENAVTAARKAFGAHFVLEGDPSIETRAPYDVIFHVGTIGCVAHPVGITRKLLNLLKPGGRLLFNAPNRDACILKDQLWFESAPPPDVVTLFMPGFWYNCFSGAAEIVEHIEFRSPNENLLIVLRKLAGRKWKIPPPIPLRESGRCSAPAPKVRDSLRRKLARAVSRAAAWTGLDRFAPRFPTEYGLFVQMRRK